MPALTFDLATPADDDALRRLLRQNPMPGSIAVSFEREPSYFRAGEVEGPFHQTLVARDPATRQIVGCANRSVRPLYVNGSVQPIGYLSQLRADGAYGWGLSRARTLAQGFHYLRQLHADARAPFYLLSVIADNAPARRLLTSALSGMPRLTEYTRYHTYAIFLGRRRPAHPLPRWLSLTRAMPAHTQAILDCLQRNGKRHQFAPCWNAETLFQSQCTPGLGPENFFLALRGERVVGCLAMWDQSSFKQTIVRGYSGALGYWRRWINLATPLTGGPALPEIHSPIRHCFASHLAVDDSDAVVFAALLRAVYNEAAARGFNYLMLGLAEAHPFCPVAQSYRHILYPSQIYLVGWEASREATANVDRRLPGLEAAVL